jgi:hypothetical protein
MSHDTVRPVTKHCELRTWLRLAAPFVTLQRVTRSTTSAYPASFSWYFKIPLIPSMMQW